MVVDGDVPDGPLITTCVSRRATMRQTGTAIISLALMLLATSCEHKPQVEDYAVQTVHQSLSNDEILSAFSALGLTLERFTCMFPDRTTIRISTETFVNSQPAGGSSEGTLTVNGGLQELILFIIESEDGTVKFSLKSSTGSISCGSASVKNYHGRTGSAVPIEELTQTPQPIFLYAANEDGVEGLSSDADMDRVLDIYDFVMVISMSIPVQMMY
jgi:hypothetical protein